MSSQQSNNQQPMEVHKPSACKCGANTDNSKATETPAGSSSSSSATTMAHTEDPSAYTPPCICAYEDTITYLLEVMMAVCWTPEVHAALDYKNRVEKGKLDLLTGQTAAIATFLRMVQGKEWKWHSQQLAAHNTNKYRAKAVYPVVEWIGRAIDEMREMMLKSKEALTKTEAAARMFDMLLLAMRQMQSHMQTMEEVV